MLRVNPIRLFLCIVVFAVATSSLLAAPQLGKKVENFTLRSHLGREWSLNDFSDRKVIAIIFLGTECPLAKLYGPRLAELHARFADQGVGFIGINANTQDSLTELHDYAVKHKIPFPMLKDVGNEVADAMHAERTPEVFVLDQDRKVRYHGRIDDQYGVGVSRDKILRPHLAMAIEELLAGTKVSIPETKMVGCHIGRVKKVKPTGNVTYSNQIARIFQKRCVECHRDSEIAPFPLTRYEDVIGWEDTILEVIEDQRMPPWYANPKHGKFQNDARLNKEEKDLIARWVKNGMPEGDPSQLPPPAEFVDGWRIPKPDQVVQMRDKAFTVPDQGVVDYQHFVVDPGWKEEKYIYAAEARPQNTSVVHHILVYIIPPGERKRGNLGTVLVGYAPGSTPVLLEEGIAIHAPAGSKLMFELHYTPNGYEQEDLSYVGICFKDKQEVTKKLRGRTAINTDFSIPPNADNHVVLADYRFRHTEQLLSMTPHMHLRGKSFRFEATYPNGEKEILLDVPRYDFNWQLKYILDEPKIIPQGTTIQCRAVFDNSEDNPANPEPDKTVRWGEQSWEEMMIGFMDTVPVDRKNTTRLSKNVSIDPSGTWSWQRAFGSRKIDESLTLKLDKNKLSGVLETAGKSIAITDAVIEGNRLTFHVSSPEFAGLTVDFEAEVTTDALKGKATLNFESVGRTHTLPWNAQRAEEEQDK